MSLDKISVYKIKPDVEEFDDFLKGDGFRELILPNMDLAAGVETRAGFKNIGGKAKDQNAIPWLAFINSGLEQDPFTFNSRNRFPSAVLAVKFIVEDQSIFFALTFGLGGDSFIDHEKIVRDFGIKVAMNMCDPDNLKRIQTAVHESIATQTERQISAGAAISVFHLNDEREFLRTIAGAAKDEFEYVGSFKGRESIAIKFKKDTEFSWHKLIKTLLELNSLSDADDYKSIFRGYDKFVLEADKQVIQELDDVLFKKIKAGDLDKIHMAPPEFFDFDTYTFKYVDKDEGQEFDDLRISELLESHRRLGRRSSIASIKKWQIFVQNSETGIRRKEWTAYKCLVAEQEKNDVTYILSNGYWRSVDSDFYSEVNDYVSNIRTSDLDYLPSNVSICRVGEDGKRQNREEYYNSQAVAISEELFLFDKAKIEIAGERKYEICDILHKDKKFIHVKRYSNGCASISHLFVQTKFYADGFLSDAKCRQGMRNYIEASDHDANNGKDIAAFQAVVPEDRTDISEKEYGVVICVLSTKNDFTVDDLPFMAKYELMSTHQYLTTNRGFDCCMTIREVTVDDVPLAQDGEGAAE